MKTLISNPGPETELGQLFQKPATCPIPPQHLSPPKVTAILTFMRITQEDFILMGLKV